MRLIDANELKRSISQNNKIPRIFQQVINNQPTAYDIDKVVKELKDLREKENICDYLYCNVCDYLYCDVCLCNEKCGVETDQSDDLKWDKAIEIVKQGSVSDNVCEWKYTREIMDNAEFKVGCNPNALKRGIVPNNFSYCNFKYCPYCGKKIKVVE